MYESLPVHLLSILLFYIQMRFLSSMIVLAQKTTRIDVYKTLCPQQMLVHKGGKIKNWGGECRDVTPTNCSLKIYLKRALGGSGWRGQHGCE